MHNGHAFAVPFPAAGEGIVIRFTMLDLAKLRSKYGNDRNTPVQRDENGHPIDSFWAAIFNGLENLDPMVYLDLIEAGLKKADAKAPLRLPADDFTFSIEDAYEALRDALCYARSGKSNAELMAERQAALANSIAEAEEELRKVEAEHPTIGSVPATS